MKHADIINQMTLEEKCFLLSGKDFWQTRSVERLGVRNMLLSDGPHGVRRQAGSGDQLGLNPSLPATCFPTAATIANSWDPALGEEIGQCLGEEAASQGVGVLLGPGLNIKRSPLCGRNFEYFSEDPYLAGKMAAGYIRGIQKNGVSACPKHFACNSQELRRMASDSVVDERTLREIYLTGFEIAVKEGKAKALMSSYNRVNGVYANENYHLLQEILRDEWCFDGFVVSDWGGSNEQYVGYRYYETANIPVLFPFGFGLSYTTFAYSDLKISEKEASFTLTNTGKTDGAEVAQLYVSKTDAQVFRPVKELKGFQKVFLKAGESKTVTIPLDDKAFRYFNVKTNRFEVEGGKYQVLVGASAADIRLSGSVSVAGTDAPNPYNSKLLSDYYTGSIKAIPDTEFENLLGHPIPDGTWSGTLTMNDAICQMYYARSGLAYFCAYMVAMTIGEVINFPIQRNFVFRSHGNLAKQIGWYMLAFIIITCIVNSINCIWVAVAGQFVPPAVYNIGSTVLNGGISMIIFFFVNKIIFPEGEAKK